MQSSDIRALRRRSWKSVRRLQLVWNGASWQTRLGLLCVAASGAMLTGSWYFLSRTAFAAAVIAGTHSNLQVNPQQASQVDSQSALSLPPESEYLKDLKHLFLITTAEGIKPTQIDYRLDMEVAPPFLVRQIAVKVNDDYPKVRSLIANVLQSLNNAALLEVRIERAGTAANANAAYIRFGFIYEPAPTTTKVSRP